MSKFVLRPKARDDLDGIWDYTLETWGRVQAKTYLRALSRTFKTLAGNPELGRIRDDVYRGLRVYPSGKHLIFYLAIDNGIGILRVLLERMDTAAHL